MPKRSRKKKKRPSDINSLAAQIVNEATEEPAEEKELTEKELRSRAAAILGRLGGLKGGKARAKALSPERRREIAQKAIKARWAKRNKK